MAQVAYAHAASWQAALQLKLASQNEVLRPSAERVRPQREDADAGYCQLEIILEPLPEYPREVARENGVGAVMVHANLDAEGNVIKRQVAAAVPHGPLSDAVEAVFEHWRFEQDRNSLPDCRLNRSIYVLLRFGPD